jgi:photosystem II stability/assembly factor-like uncharacterized protein
MVRNIIFVIALALVASTCLADWVAIGPDGGNITALALDPQQPATLYALPYEYPSGPRVFKTTTGGGSWATVGLLPDYNVTMLIVDPHQSDYLYGMTSSAVWRSTDGGASWDSSGLPAYASSMAADPLVPGRVFVSGYRYSSYYVPAVMFSTDYGQSWDIADLDTDTAYAYCVAFDPVDTGTAYVGCSNGLVFRTGDGGADWDSACAGLPATSAVQSIAVNSSNPHVVLAGAGDGLYRSTDAGTSWGRVGAMTSTFDLGLSPADPALAYCLGYDTAPCLYVSTDTGATWAAQPGNLQQGKSGSLIVDPANADLVYSPGPSGVARTADRGQHWQAANTGIRLASIPAISSGAWNPDAVYAEASENAVFQSQSGGDSWTRCADFLSCGAICGIGLAPGGGADVMWALEGSG